MRPGGRKEETIVTQFFITKASLLAGVGFPLGMYWGQSLGTGSDLSLGKGPPLPFTEVNHSHERPSPSSPPSARSNPPWSLLFEGIVDGNFFGEKEDGVISQDCKHPIWYCHIALMHILPGPA